MHRPTVTRHTSLALRGGGDARGHGRPDPVLDGCSVLWPSAVAFSATGSVMMALTVAASACAMRFLWVGGARASSERIRAAAAAATAGGDDRRARVLYERLWVLRHGEVAAVDGEHDLQDRVAYAGTLNRLGDHRRAALIILERGARAWSESPELHRALEELGRRLAERLIEARRPRLARRVLRLSVTCARWRERIPTLDRRTSSRETGWLWLRLGEGHKAVACFLRSMRDDPDAQVQGIRRQPREGTGPYRAVGSGEVRPRVLGDDLAALGLAEAYLLTGEYEAALAEFTSLASPRRCPERDSPLAVGRVERGRARALVLLGRANEALEGYERALQWDLRGDLSQGGAVLDCLEAASIERHRGAHEASAQWAEQASVLAVGAEQREMVRLFCSGTPLSSAQTRWCAVPRLPRGTRTRGDRAARSRVAGDASASGALGVGALKTDERFPPHATIGA